MTTITTATQLVKTILAFNFHKTDEVSTWTLQGCEFNICDGVLGYVHPVLGWWQVYDFNGSDPRGGTAVENIQWTLDEYGNNYTYQVIDHEAYECSGLPYPQDCGHGLVIACSNSREHVLDLEQEGTIVVLSIDPIQ